jgi:hypothetical protein
MRITQYAVGVLLIAALAGCSITPMPYYKAGSPEEARWQSQKTACIETGGSYKWSALGRGQWNCKRSAEGEEKLQAERWLSAPASRLYKTYKVEMRALNKEYASGKITEAEYLEQEDVVTDLYMENIKIAAEQRRKLEMACNEEEGYRYTYQGESELSSGWLAQLPSGWVCSRPDNAIKIQK